MESGSKVLIVGCTGYIGRFITSASLRLGFPTYLLIRPDTSHDVHKSAMVVGYKRAGASLLECSLDDHEGLVKALKQVDVVISCIAEKYLQDQFKIIDAIKQVENIRRFVPSEFGMDPCVMTHAIAPGDEVFKDKRKIRTAIQNAGIPFTYVSANCFAGYFLAGIAQLGLFMPPRESIVMYGTGDTKVIWVDEDDIGTYVVQAATDPRTLNKSVYIRPPENILSQKEVLQIWEGKVAKVLQQSTMSEKEILDKVADEKQPFAFRVAAAHFYQIFYKGDLLFDIGPNGCDTAQLYPEVKYTTVSSYLDRYV